MPKPEPDDFNLEEPLHMTKFPSPPPSGDNKSIDNLLDQFAADVFKLGAEYGKGKFAIINPWIKFRPTEAILSLITIERNRARVEEITKIVEWGKTIDDQWNNYFIERLKLLKNPPELKQMETKEEQ